MCLDKASVMKFGPIYKKSYLSHNCVQIPIRQEYYNKLAIERKYMGAKDEIFDIVNNAQKIDFGLN